MKKLFVAGIAAAAFLSAPALAGPPPAPFNWSGFYLGVNGGGMDFKTDGTFYNAVPGFFWHTDKKQVVLGGIHGGFQGQWGNFVAGIEGAWDAALGDGFGQTIGGGLGAPCGFGAGFQACQARINDIIQVGPRVGFAMGQWLVYGTGGYARGQIESRMIAVPGGAVAFSANNHHDGWYAGGGIDFLLLNGLAVGVEYKHFNFDHAHEDVAPGSGNNRDLKAKADAILLRLTFK
jgi:outer membrane immunogenic protein